MKKPVKKVASSKDVPVSLPKLNSVKSSNIHSIGYRADLKTLFVKFHSGGIYQYNPVEEKFYDEMLLAKSPGGHFQIVRNDTSIKRSQIG